MRLRQVIERSGRLSIEFNSSVLNMKSMAIDDRLTNIPSLGVVGTYGSRRCGCRKRLESVRSLDTKTHNALV